MNTSPPSALAKIKQIFSDEFVRESAFKFWSVHLEWLRDHGFARALEQQEGLVNWGHTGHEIVDLLSEYIASHGYVNAHLGLTSSDVIDNIRLSQVWHAQERIHMKIEEARTLLELRFNRDIETVGFTHFMPAAPILWGDRSLAWQTPLLLLQRSRPKIHAKRLGGPVGDAASMVLIFGNEIKADHAIANFPYGIFGTLSPRNQFPLQSSDHLDELESVQWCCAVAAQLHKIAQDLRILASRELIRIGTSIGHAGSSSMPHKINPYKWEKVCSICRSVSTTQDEVWAVMAHNGLERTLDTSWQIKQALKRCYEGLALALDEFCAVECCIAEFADACSLKAFRDRISSDRDLTRRVLNGENRWSAYLDMLGKNKTTGEQNQP